MADLNVKITTAADLAGTDAAKAGLKGIAQEADAVAASGKGTTASLDGLAGGLKKIPQLAAALGLAVGLKEAIAAAAQLEAQTNQLTVALANNGQETQANTERLLALAASLQETTGIADGEWREALIRLINTGQVQANQIDQHVEAVKRLAGIMRVDATTAASVYARALQGNFDMLGRYGIQIEATLSKEEKLLALREQLVRGAGLLEARNQGLEGGMNGLKNSVSALLGSVGALLNSGGFLATQMSILAEFTSALSRGFASAEAAAAPLAESVGDLAVKFSDGVHSGAGLVEVLGGIAGGALSAEEAQVKLTEALTAAAVAQIKLKAARGEISPEEASRQIGEISASAAATQAAERLAKLQAEQVDLQRLLTESQARDRGEQFTRDLQLGIAPEIAGANPPESSTTTSIRRRLAAIAPEMQIAEVQRAAADTTREAVRTAGERARTQETSEGVAGVTKLLEPGAREQETQARRDAERQAREAQRLAEGTSRLRETAAAALGETLSAVERLQRDMENMKARVANLRTH